MTRNETLSGYRNCIVLGAALLLVYTVVKFYLLKPNHVPQPEKEHIRVGSPLGNSTGADNFKVTHLDFFAYFRNPSEAQRSPWCGSSRFWGR